MREEEQDRRQQPDRRSEQTMRELLENIDEHPFGIITQKGYKDLQNQIRRWIVWSLVAFGAIGITSIVALIGFGVFLDNQGDLTAEIQQQRYNTIVQSCQDQNNRHDEVIRRVDDAVERTPPPSAQQKRAKESAQPFKLILEAAVPFTEDCKEYAADRVNGLGP